MLQTIFSFYCIARKWNCRTNVCQFFYSEEERKPYSCQFKSVPITQFCFCMFHSFIDFWKNPPNNIWPFPLGLHLVLSLMKKYETQLFSDKVHASRWQGLFELKKRSFEPSFTKRASALLIKQRVHFVMQKWLKMQKCIDQTSVLLYYSDLFVKGVVSLLIFNNLPDSSFA